MCCFLTVKMRFSGTRRPPPRHHLRLLSLVARACLKVRSCSSRPLERMQSSSVSKPRAWWCGEVDGCVCPGQGMTSHMRVSLHQENHGKH